MNKIPTKNTRGLPVKAPVKAGDGLDDWFDWD